MSAINPEINNAIAQLRRRIIQLEGQNRRMETKISAQVEKLGDYKRENEEMYHANRAQSYAIEELQTGLNALVENEKKSRRQRRGFYDDYDNAYDPDDPYDKSGTYDVIDNAYDPDDKSGTHDDYDNAYETDDKSGTHDVIGGALDPLDASRNYNMSDYANLYQERSKAWTGPLAPFANLEKYRDYRVKHPDEVIMRWVSIPDEFRMAFRPFFLARPMEKK